MPADASRDKGASARVEKRAKKSKRAGNSSLKGRNAPRCVRDP